MNKILIFLATGVLVAGILLGWVYCGKVYNFEAEPYAAPEESLFFSEGEKVIPELPAHQVGDIGIIEMRSSRYFDYMAMNSMMPLHSALQEKENPVSLEIKSGVYALSELEDGKNIIRGKDSWIITIPIIVHPLATLIIDTGDDPVLLQADKGVFLSSFGTLFVKDSTIRGHLPERQSSNYKMFRPYIVTWSGGSAYFSNSQFFDLGYDQAKSYGMTFSSSAIMEREEGKKTAPTGVLKNNVFTGLYYGFYSYEAEDIVITHNKYEKNVVYGIDPHDDSRNLIIAYNTVTGTMEKHGIILSRNIKNSRVIGNTSSHNAGSGIMIERHSTGNLIEGNVMEHNKGDGLVFLESPDNVSRNNRMRKNEKSGIRIRNSWNIFMKDDEASGNGEYGFRAYTKLLDDQEERDLEKDPYKRDVDFSLRDCKFTGNKAGHMNIEGAREARLSNLTLLGSPKSILGDLAEFQTDIYTHGTVPESTIVFKRERFYADFLWMR